MQKAIDAFLQSKRRQGRAEETLILYRRVLRQYHIGGYGWPPTPDDVEAFVGDCRNRKLKRNTIRAYYDALNHFLGWCSERGHLANGNPADVVPRPKRGRQIPRAPSRDTIRTFLDTLADGIETADRRDWIRVRDLAIFCMLFECGLRLGELCNLKIGDVVFDVAVEDIDDLEVSGAVFVSSSKTGDQRTVYFGSFLAPLLRDWLETRPKTSDPHFFVRLYRGEYGPVTSRGIRAALYRWIEKAGVPHFHPHALRHAYAIFRLRGDMKLIDIQNQMGHRNLTTTAIYLNVPGVEAAIGVEDSSPIVGLYPENGR